MNTPTADQDEAQMMDLRAMSYELGTTSDKARNSGSWERRGEDLKTLGMTHKHEGSSM